MSSTLKKLQTKLTIWFDRRFPPWLGKKLRWTYFIWEISMFLLTIGWYLWFVFSGATILFPYFPTGALLGGIFGYHIAVSFRELTRGNYLNGHSEGWNEGIKVGIDIANNTLEKILLEKKPRKKKQKKH